MARAAVGLRLAGSAPAVPSSPLPCARPWRLRTHRNPLAVAVQPLSHGWLRVGSCTGAAGRGGRPAAAAAAATGAVLSLAASGAAATAAVPCLYGTGYDVALLSDLAEAGAGLELQPGPAVLGFLLTYPAATLLVAATALYIIPKLVDVGPPRGGLAACSARHAACGMQRAACVCRTAHALLHVMWPSRPSPHHCRATHMPFCGACSHVVARWVASTCRCMPHALGAVRSRVVLVRTAGQGRAGRITTPALLRTITRGVGGPACQRDQRSAITHSRSRAAPCQPCSQAYHLRHPPSSLFPAHPATYPVGPTPCRSCLLAAGSAL